jgi:hypothetical protein
MQTHIHIHKHIHTQRVKDSYTYNQFDSIADQYITKLDSLDSLFTFCLIYYIGE